ncbi:Flap structure-specific endonuclease [Seiridium cupressi]
MGIKGIYKEIGPGKRISLTKLAVEHLEQTERPLRIAIDIAIWQFQAQAARGGSNPAIRTLFYRLLRLLSLHIQPVFVFDGPNKPVFKRNKRSGRGDGVATSMAKRLVRLFGFQVHDAPGEAEAECALLQLNGIVDAVLSEDVDTIMFGCTKTMRNWSAEGKGNTPTHISMYDTAELRQGEEGLDREGMVLVALMSGGDYLPEGIPGAGVKLACEAARAGFGKSLCRLKRSDVVGLTEWKANLKHELVTNESRFFRTKHKALTVPEDFPNLDVLRYYTHPVVSPTSTLDRFRALSWDKPLDILGLRDFVRETFDWEYRGGAIKFIRVLAPCLLVKKIMGLGSSGGSSACDVEEMQKEEGKLVRAITNRREHFSTDATPELRVSFTPTNIVGYNFEEEPEEEILFGREGLALNSDDEFEAGEEGTLAKVGPKKPFSPNEPDLSWIPETITKLGLPLMVEDWEETQRAKVTKKSKAKAPNARPKTKLGGMPAGVLDKFVRVTKDIPGSLKASETSQSDKAIWPIKPRNPLGLAFPPSQKHPLPHAISNTLQKSARTSSVHSKQPTKSTISSRNARGPPLDPAVNPWSIANSLSPSKQKPNAAAAAKSAEAIFISSSPPASPIKTTRPQVRRTSSPSPANSEHSSPIASPRKQRSRVPMESNAGSSRPSPDTRACSPTPQTDERYRRKLARTESMPAESSRGAKNLDIFGATRRTLARARTIAVEPQLRDSEDENDTDDDDLDLPPLSAFTGRIPKEPSPAPSTPTLLPDTSLTLQDSTVSITIDSSPASVLPLKPLPPVKAAAVASKKQSKLSDTFGMRTTKMYAPRKSEPGFFREIEVTVAEAERMESKRGGSRKWRQSDVSVVDLTGDD